MTVSLPAERLDGVVGERLRDIARTANIKGFRKGKVPTKVIQQRFGDQVRNEAFNDLVRSTFDQALREQQVKIAGAPSIQTQSFGEDGGEIRYTATFEVVPDFGPIDVAKLKGFRPGRIPPKVIEQRYGTQVREEALGELIRQSFDEAVRREKLLPVRGRRRTRGFFHSYRCAAGAAGFTE
jgi:FKBP-type peptidyl-prolyl cis-trans isomerase (trigger factor)